MATVALSVGLSTGCSTTRDDLSYSGVVSAPDYTSSELAEMRALSLEQLAVTLRLDPPPDVDLARYVLPEEWVEAQLTCLTEVGFEVARTPDGEGVSGAAVPANLQDQYRETLYACSAKYTLDPRYEATLNSSQIKFVYWYYTTPLRDCLAREGYDAGSVPSEATFIDTYESADSWSPYRVLSETGELDITTLVALMAECPQSPPSNQLWPGE